MDKLQIEQAAKEYTDKTWIGDAKRISSVSFKAGATFVNTKQPYTGEDMESFGNFLMQLVKDFNEGKEIPKWETFDELIKLWEESKNDNA